MSGLRAYYFFCFFVGGALLGLAIRTQGQTPQDVDQSAGQESSPDDPLSKAKALQGFLAVFLSAHSTKHQIAKAKPATLQVRRTRRQAYQLVLALDHQLQLLQLSLSYFLPLGVLVGQLSPVEIRYEVPWSSWPYELPPGTESFRIAIKNTATGQKRWEVGDVRIGRPVLSLAHDRGSINMAAIHFLENFLHMRVTPWSDPFHDCWNDVKGAFQEANKWRTFVDLGHVFNVASGPWMSGANFRSLQGFAKDYIGQMHIGNDLFGHLYPSIAEDMGITDMIGTEEHTRQVLDTTGSVTHPCGIRTDLSQNGMIVTLLIGWCFAWGQSRSLDADVLVNVTFGPCVWRLSEQAATHPETCPRGGTIAFVLACAPSCLRLSCSALGPLLCRIRANGLGQHSKLMATPLPHSLGPSLALP